MSRENKFRAWDEINNKWIDGCDLIMESSGRVWAGDVNNPPMIQIKSENVVFFTGLKDKHGTGIFEGDIVQFKSIRDIIERYEVEYTNYGEWAIGMHRLSMRFRSCEVIGNVHEHSHLLEETA